MIIRALYAQPKMRFPIGSWLIRLVEFGKVSKDNGSHIALEFLGPQMFCVFDSVSPRSRVVSIDKWNDKYTILKAWKFEIPDENYQEVSEWVWDHTDIPYSRLQCVFIGLGEIFGGFVRKAMKKLGRNQCDYLICVEAAVRALHKFCGVVPTSDPDAIGLSEFIELMDNTANKKA